ncbi:DUF6531 domain-containing protein, partial [Klugiella xanthotipulae]|uniref:DUF6531 domain-containing protein n=1 Tax=Klugiella xanthotipulae TaxID=244735 RepID=UPI0031D948DB
MNAIDNQRSSRASYVRTAQQDFRGYFAEAFARNSGVASRSASALAGELQTLSGYVTELRQAAEDEDKRRTDARAWAKRQREREENWFVGAGHEISSWFGAEDDPKPPSPAPEPHLTSTAVTVSGRDIPAQGGGRGTSSAVPAHLRSFQTGCHNLDQQLTSQLASFKNALSDYETGCNPCWGTLNAQSLATAFKTWLDANQEDSEWAGVVAGVFEAAGGGSGVISVSDASLSAALASAGINTQRDDFTIEPFSAVGTPPTNGYSDDPVNTATGNFLEPEVDLPFMGAAASLQFTRMYNSLDPRLGVFGVGWASLLDTRLDLDDEGAGFVMSDGRQIRFPRLGDGWGRGIDENYWLAQEPRDALPLRGDDVGRHAFVVRNNSGGWWAFTPAGAWLGSGNGSGTVILVSRDTSGRITRLVHERGRSVEVEYVGDRVAYASASDGRRAEYLYDDAERLIGVQDAVGTRRYRWTDQGLIDQVTSASGVVECENTYDSTGRVIRQVTPYGRSVRFAYLRGRVTSVSDDDGTNANTWIADRKGRVVGIIDAEGNRQSMAYDQHGNLVSATERDGQVTVHAFDDRARKIRTVTPEGADLTFGYDDQDRVTTVVTASGGTVNYTYARSEDRNPSVVTDPGGGRTELTWAHGLLLRTVDPEGVSITFEYDPLGDLVGITNAAGDTSRLVRDHTGRVVEAVTATGCRTRYRYDDAGLLVGREDPDGSVWRFEHGIGGRVIAVIDPLGARTEHGYGQHGELVTTVDPLGRATHKDFDEFGNVSAVTLPDGAEWGFAHDALSRLRTITDPAGGVWGREYDVTGNLAATVDPTGVRTDILRSRADGIQTVRGAFEQNTIHRDEFGRPTRIEQSDGSADLMVYDACGRPVEILNADGGLTQIERDRAGRVVQVTTPAGMTARYEYDECGRPAVAIDATGARTTLTYDADSRVIARTTATGEIAETEYDRMGRVTLERAPGIGVSRYRYDKAGRLTGAQDTRYGKREFRYDAAGQLIAAVNGLGGVTTYEYDERGRLVTTIDPLGGETRRTYTAGDQVASSTDPLGRVTTATYDPAGRQLTQTDPDGNTTEWEYNGAGLESGMRVNGHLTAQIVRDARARTATITDHTRDNAGITHTLHFNRLDRLVRRTTDDGAAQRETAWEYDADGNRTALIAPDGTRVEYQRDAAGRITRIVHGTFGEARLDYDKMGRLTETRTGDSLHTWEYENGYPAQHTRTTAEGADVTRIMRDAEGRITQISDPATAVTYSYDDACQLVGAATANSESTWTYDQAGRLHTESVAGHTRSFGHDAAGQLLAVTDSRDETTRYEYDGQGRRVSSVTGESRTDYQWDGRGWLSGVLECGLDGTRETELWVNALGELSEVGGSTLDWDAASGVPSLLRVDTTTVFTGPAGIIGIGNEWAPAGWRSARVTDANDPWQVFASIGGGDAAGGLGMPGGVAVAVDGGLVVAGLEWMGARAYDSVSRGFLSVDPLSPVVGAAWGGNPYSYAGNDPLHATDPWGLAPVTDEELTGYADSLQGPLAQAAGAAG